MNIVITGSTRGIGFGLAKAFLSKNHSVLINGRNEEKLEESLCILQRMYPDRDVYGFACDVSDYTSVEYMHDYACKVFTTIDIWINNAGIDQYRENVWEHNPRKMSEIVDVNIKGVLNGTRVAGQRMVKYGGFIYNMEGFGSDGRTMKMMSLYGMTKRATTYYTESAAKEAAGTKLKIGILSPGMVLTDFMLKSLPKSKKAKERYLKIYNILGDKVEDVTAFLVKKMEENKRNGVRIIWLTKKKVMLRFIKQLFNKRTLKGLE